MKSTIFILFTSILFILSCGDSYSGKKQPVAVNGVLDLREWDFNKDGPTNLNGNWKFYWNKLVPPGEINDEKSTLMKVHSSWNNQIVNNQVIPDHGFATYSVKVLIKPTNFPLALKFLTIGSAFDCFINGKKISSVGKVGKTYETMTAKYNPLVIEFIDSSNELDITIHVSNFHQKFSGIWLPIKIGNSKNLFKLRATNLQIAFLIVGVSIIMFFYYMGLFSLRPKERITLYFALFCLFMGIRIIFVDELAITEIYPDLPIGLIIKINYLTFYLSVAVSLKFLYNSFPLDYHKIYIQIVEITFIIISIITLVTPAIIFTHTLFSAQILFCITMIYTFIINILTVIRKRDGAIPILLGFMAIYAASINDVLLTWQIINSSHLVSFGFVIMLFFQSYMISLRFSKAFTTVENLSLKVDKKNIELQDMNINLEKTVKQRTVELETERNKLKSRNEIVEKELTLTKIIQQEFIPRETPSENIHSLYKPMEKVGGDFYDFLHFRDSKNIGFFLSDVSGHGIPAAFITSMVKTIILQSGSKRENPSELLKYLNEVLYDNTAGNFITAFYGIYNPTKRTILYANAGHCYPYIIKNEISQLQGTNQTAISMFSNEILKKNNKFFTNHTKELPAKSKLLLYTDGLIEAKPIDGEEFFEDSKMFEIFLQNKDQPCKKFIENLYKELISFRKEENFEDDICLVCLDVE